MAQRALPPVTDTNEYRKQNQRALSAGLKLPPTPKAPWNFRATNQRGGVLLQWSVVNDADGYEVHTSDNGDFSAGKEVVFPLRDPGQNKFFDSVGGAVKTKYYRVRATAGTSSNPYAVHGTFTGVLKQTSIDASDTVTTPTTIYDTATTDKTQRQTAAWKIGTNSAFENGG